MHRSFYSWLAAAGIARAPALMAPVAFTTATGLVFADPDRGGLLASAFTIGMLMGIPAAIECQRRFHARKLLPAQLLAAAVLWGGLTWCVQGSGPWWGWMTLAASADLVSSGSAGLNRSTMAEVVPASQAARASSLDSASLDVLIFLAPLAVSAGARLGGTGALGAVAATAALAVAASRRLHPADARPEKSPPTPRLTAGHRSDIAAWSGFGLAVGIVLAAAEAGATDLVHAQGLGYERAYLVFLVMSLASVAGGVLDAVMATQIASSRRLAFHTIAFAAGSLLLAGRTNLATIIIALTLLGAPTAALLGIRSHHVDSWAPQRRSSALTAVMAAQNIGFATGATALYWLGQPAVLILGAITTLFTAILAWQTSRAPIPSPPTRPRH